jgi:hypothetical protein
VAWIYERGLSPSINRTDGFKFQCVSNRCIVHSRYASWNKVVMGPSPWSGAGWGPLGRVVCHDDDRKKDIGRVFGIFHSRFVSISPGKIGSLVGLKRDLNAGTVGSQCNIWYDIQRIWIQPLSSDAALLLRRILVGPSPSLISYSIFHTYHLASAILLHIEMSSANMARWVLRQFRDHWLVVPRRNALRRWVAPKRQIWSSTEHFLSSEYG